MLDVASGEGYGSALLAQTARSVSAVEIDSRTVEHAAANYQSENLRFLLGSAQAIPIDSQSVDAVVSFETIEHFYEQEKFLSEIRRVLRPDGLLIISSPNRDTYSAPGAPPNPHHVRELTRNEFKQALSHRFRHVKILGQRPIVGSVVIRDEVDAEGGSFLTFDRRAEDLFECASGFDRPLYYIALATDAELSKLPESVYFDLKSIDDIAHVPALQSALTGRDREIAQLVDELSRVKAERDGAAARLRELEVALALAKTARLTELEAVRAAAQADLTRVIELEVALIAAQARTARLAKLEAALARLTSERNSALAALDADKADFARLNTLCQELATEVRKVLRQPWRPLAQRCLHLLFSAPAAPGRIGKFFARQAAQRTPGRLEGLVREADAETGRLTALEAVGEGPSPAEDVSSPAEIEQREQREQRERRILVADYRIPRPDVSAGERATVGILEDLCALGYEVTFLPADMRPSGQYEEDLRRLGVRVVTQQSGLGGVTEFVEQFGGQFGVFYLIRMDVAEVVLPVARMAAPEARIIFHAPDLYFLRERREAEYRRDEQSRRRAVETCRREISIMSASDHVVLVSSSEVPVVGPLLPNTPISVFPVLYAPVADDPRGFQGRRDIFFLGGFAHTPNVDAVRWFATEIWPHIHGALPGVEFHIVGAEAPSSVVELGQLPGVKVVGFVRDLEPVLDAYRVGVAPLLFGAGIKGKVATTMGAGIPCVCTPIAAEGMGLEPGLHALIEADPRCFAEAVVTLYEDESLWSRLSAHGRALIGERFGNSANRASLLATLNDARALPIALFHRYCVMTGPAAVPAPETDVDVSIIIPVYNKWELTRACITSVLQTSAGGGVRFEVILADDNSRDETVRAAELFPGLRIVRTPENLGFLRNCNHAARAARGRYLLFLNNDTVVLPGWLEALFRTMESDPAIGIAGSKLLYPDGIIQEAGGAIFRDGSARNVGRGQERDTPVFNAAREVDYISGASILVRADFWRDVGGFDERFKVAYCEDSDLAMTARARGLTVRYEPKSEVVHFEHQSYKDQEDVGPKALQLHNTALLLEKWGDVLLSDHGRPNHDPWTVPPAAQSRPVSALRTVA